MSRFNLAVTVLTTSFSINAAFVPSAPAVRVASSLYQSNMGPPNYNDPNYDPFQRVESAVENLAEGNAEQSVERAMEQLIGNTPGNQPELSFRDYNQAEINISSVLEEAAVALDEANQALGNPEQQGEQGAKEKNLDEEISLTIATITKSTMGTTISRTYVNTRQTLRDARAKNEKRLSRSTFEKQKAAEKIASIKAKMEDQISTVEKELEQKLDSIQTNFDGEMNIVTNLLVSQVELEKNRLEKISELKTCLEGAITRKSTEIASEENITQEMLMVRSKLKTGNISNQLDLLIEEKKQLAKFEQAQLEDLKAFVATTESILANTRFRAQAIENALRNVRPVAIKLPGEAQYDFSEFRQLESMWDEAAKIAEEENGSIVSLKKKFDEEFLNKIILLGEEIPEYLQKAATDLQIQQLAKAQVQQKNNAIQQNQGVATKKEQNEYELLGMVAKNVGKAAFDSAKAGVFGIKAVIDSVNEKEVSEKLKSTAKKELDEESLKAIGEAGRSIANHLGQSESAAQASDALKDTSEDLGSAFKALGALGKKAAGRWDSE